MPADSYLRAFFIYMTYSEKLKDPRWQKKRLEILQRDNWACTFCGDKNSTLHVHHQLYEKGKEPWDASEWVLITLCENCHEIVHFAKTKMEKFLLDCLMNRMRQNKEDFQLLNSVIKNLDWDNY